jgi:hypothetical protein
VAQRVPSRASSPCPHTASPSIFEGRTGEGGTKRRSTALGASCAVRAAVAVGRTGWTPMGGRGKECRISQPEEDGAEPAWGWTGWLPTSRWLQGQPAQGTEQDDQTTGCPTGLRSRNRQQERRNAVPSTRDSVFEGSPVAGWPTPLGTPGDGMVADTFGSMNTSEFAFFQRCQLGPTDVSANSARPSLGGIGRSRRGNGSWMPLPIREAETAPGRARRGTRPGHGQPWSVP